MAEVILTDRYGFTTKPAWTGARPEARYLRKGDEVTADTFAESNIGADNELERGRSIGAIGDPAILAAQAAALAAPRGRAAELSVSATNDAELTAMQVEDLAAHVTQYPGDRDRIIRLEVMKGTKARKGVLELANLDVATTPLEEAAAAERAEAAASGS